MQTFALAFALTLLGLGALLNTVVLAYFLWRACRVLNLPKPHVTGLLHRNLAPAHR